MPQDVKDLVDSLKGPALDSVLTDIRGRIGDQLTEIAGLNTRAAAGLTSGTILTALTALQNARPGVAGSTTVQILFVVAFIAYAVVVVSALSAYRPRDFKTGLPPAEMIMRYVPVPHPPALDDHIRQRMANDLVKDFDTNERKIERKFVWTWIVFFGVVAEAGLLAVITGVHLWGGS